MSDVPQVVPELLPGLRADLAGYTVDAIAAALAALLEAPEGQVRAEVVTGVRSLAADGFLRPA